MFRIHNAIAHSQQLFASLLEKSLLLSQGSASIEQYVRYLSMQYHLTKGVQRHFITVSAHSDFCKRKKLRKFLFDFANEEELHYIVAANDLYKLNQSILPEPFDVTLWHSYFEKVMVTRPFVRMGAACILENISAGVARSFVKQALSAPFIVKDNSKFLVLHQHETLPHGDQILEALTTAALDEYQILDLLEGARKATVFYLRMAEWAVNPNCLAALGDAPTTMLNSEEKQSIATFDMGMLDAHNG